MSVRRAWTTGGLAAHVGARCEGDPEVRLRGVASLSTAGAGDLAFCRGGRWLPMLSKTSASAVLVRPEMGVPSGVVALRHDDPRYAYALAAAAIMPTFWPEPGIHDSAIVDPTAQVEGATVGPLAVIGADAVVGPGAWVMAHAYIGRGTRVGERAKVMPHAVVMDGCTLGARVWLQPGAVVGADGFGQVMGPDGVIRVPQLGTAVLEEDVEIGANACVDRAALGETRVCRGSRLDNLVQVAHGVRIGAHCLLAAFAGVAGGARLGDGVVMAGRTAVIDGIEVGDGAVFAGLASASKDVPPGAKIGGSPARSYRRWLREVAALKQLPGALRAISRLERLVDEREG